ncbi:hypothetical protein B0H11DRAFT_2251700 [Mycena galericulata]|nr:hypothetical protein B0H11DRAFT_2251700 [Mycena galericulata]
MDNDSVFNKSEWIGQHKVWASAPPKLRKLATEFFLIPQQLEHDLLPSPYLSITKMVEFTLPLQNATAAALPPAQFFTMDPPDITDQALMLRVRRLPIPDSKTINKLLASSHQAWLDGAQSVIYSHVGGAVTHFPLWILTHWAAVDDAQEQSDAPVVLARGQRRKIVARRYQGPAWVEH